MAKRKTPRPRARTARAAPAENPGPSDRKTRFRAAKRPAAAPWFYGSHAVLAALGNRRRACRRLLITKEALAKRRDAVTGLLAARPTPLEAELAERDQIAQRLPEGAVHQGMALQVEPLAGWTIEDVLERAGPQQSPATEGRRLVIALDQVTDPRNVGAILRSAAAFGADALIVTRDNAAPESGALAKAAAGGLEVVPSVTVTNLARALGTLKAGGFWCLGLAGEAERSLAEADPGGAVVLVLGAEGRGLRRLTRESCDLLARLPTREPIASLNVSNAAAVALYALVTR